MTKKFFRNLLNYFLSYQETKFTSYPGNMPSRNSLILIASDKAKHGLLMLMIKAVSETVKPYLTPEVELVENTKKTKTLSREFFRELPQQAESRMVEESEKTKFAAMQKSSCKFNEERSVKVLTCVDSFDDFLSCSRARFPLFPLSSSLKQKKKK